MVVGYHLIWTVYGYWLPNDPRGSMSQTIRNDVIADLGEIHYGRKRIQPAGWEIRDFQAQARLLLKHELLTFTDDEIEVVAEAFRTVIRRRGYTCYACAILPDHVHVLVRKHRDKAEDMIAKLQEESHHQIHYRGPRHGENHPVWGGPGWKVFLDSRADIERTIRYVELNPERARRPKQSWDFVTTYNGWLPGIVSRVRPSKKDNAKPQARDRRES